MRYVLALLFMTILHCSSVNAQVKSEDDLKKQAEKYFEDEEYNQAYKLYAQLVSLYPKDPEYNYRLGVCMIYTEPDKKKPFSYLQIAVKAPKDAPKDAKFYLAKTYHINYKFDDAIKLYNEYKQTAAAASVKKLQVDREIETCINGKRLLSNLSDLVVISKKQLNEADYFRSYELKDIGGKLLVKPEDFRSSIDKKKKEKSVIYLPKSGDKVYFSSYGDNGNNGRDIYFANRLPNGSWAKPQPMPAGINTEYDEDYPFLHPNGKTLYFSSKGHNSMGGYDVFKTTFNPETQSWSKPVNLEFPINSPDDDILFVTDSLEKTAYFSTGRYSPYGKLDVLKINTERRPMNFAVVKGTVVKEDANQSLLSKITVKNMDNGEVVGTYQAQDNGDYYMELPNGGQFLFTVETPGIPTQSDKVNIPVAYTLKPYKQVISYDNKILKIINYFDGQVADDNYAMMIDFIEKKAKLEINENDPYNNNLKDAAIKNNNQNANTNDLNAVSTNNPTVVNETGTNPKVNNTNKNVTNEQLLSMAKMDAKEAEDEANKLKQEATDAYGLATQKNEEAILKQKEADLALNNANAITDVNQKNEELKKAKELKDEANIASNVANTAANLAKKLEMDAIQKQKEADLTNQFIKELDAVTKNKNNKEALAKLETIQKELDQLSNQPNQSDELVNSIKAETELKQKELEKLENKNKDIVNETNLLKNEVKGLETDLSNETDNTLKENITSQIRELNSDIELKNKDLANNEQKITSIKNQVDGLNQELLLATNILNEKAGTNVIAANNNNDNNNKTNVTNENNSAVTNEAGNLNYDKLSNDYNSKLNTLQNTAENKENLTSQNDVLTAYNKELTSLINKNKDEVSKTKDAALKTKLNEEIKKAEKQKTENTNLIASNNTKINQFDNVAANNTNTNQNLNYTQLSADYNTKLTSLQNTTPTKGNLTSQNDLLNTYNNELTALINKDNNELSKTNDAGLKAKLNEEIKNAEKQKTENNNLIASNNTKINQFDNVAANNNNINQNLNYTQLSADYNTKLSNIQSTTPTKENLTSQNELLNTYNNELTALINKDKNELSKTNDTGLKTKLSEEIKNAEKQKTENNTLIASNNTKIKEFDNAVSVNNINAVNSNTVSAKENIVNENNNAINSNSVVANNNIANNNNIIPIDNITPIKSITANPTNKTAIISELNSLKTDLKTNELSASNNLASVTYQETIPNNSKQDINQKFDIVKQNETTLNNLINQIESNVSSTGSNNPENLLNEADALTNKAATLRKEASTKTGSEKDVLVKQAIENEKLAVIKKLEASTLQLNENQLTFDNNNTNLTELQKLSANKTSNEISQANLLIDEAKLNFKQAQKIKDEANNYPSDAAKLGGLNNAEEKENEALLKQQKALDILTKVNPNYQLKTIEKNNVSSDNITQLNEAINKTSQSQVEAYAALSNANENELKSQSEKLNNNPAFKTANNSHAQTLKNEADNLTKEAQNYIAQSNSAPTTSEKANLLLKANNKEAEALKKLNEAASLTNAIAANNNNANVNENNNQNEANNAVTTNTVTGNEANKARVENNNNNAANSNTTAIASNTTVTNENNAANITNENAVETNTATINETNNTNVAATTNLSDDPKKLKADLNNPKENNLSAFDAYTNSEAINLKNQANEKIAKALNEDNVIASELDKIPASANNTSGGTLSQESITNLQNEAEKLNNDAYTLRKTAATKTGTEKDNLIAQAKEMEQQATSKKLEAANNLKLLNIATYEANNQSLADLAKMAAGKNISELNDAASIVNEINAGIKQANGLRTEANNLPSDAAKLGGYNNAEEKEAWVIAKQESLLNVYKKYFSNYILKQPNLAIAGSSSDNPQLNAAKAKLNSNYNQHIDGLTTLTQANEKEYKSRFLSLPTNLNPAQINLKTLAQNSYKKSNDLITKANQSSDAVTKKNLLIEANENGQRAINLLNQIKSPEAIATNNNLNANNNANNANNINNNAAANNNMNNNNTAVSNNNKNVVKLKVEGLEIKNTNAYTANKPIPIDEKIPDGLVFKVQIGAFKTPLPNNTFKGLSPVIAQTTPNGYLRYMAGNFDKYESANAVKNDLRNLGYSDAFVVVYFNGQRITLAEAIEKLKASGQPADLVSVNNTSAGITTNANVPKNTITPATNTNLNNIDSQPVEITKELEQMNGLLYTVQIGVFSKQVTRSQLYNLKPIYTEELPNGLYRYTAGIYNQSSKLLEDKRKVVDLGVKDAFVSAYYNSKRIPFAEGQKIQAENNNLKMETENPIIFSGALSTGQINNTNPAATNVTATNVVTNPTVTPFTNNVTTEPTPTADNGVKTDDAGISFKVQIGAYMNQVPNDVAAKFSNIRTWPVKNNVINGLYIYTIGNFNAVSFAKKLRDEAVSLGISDAFITVYKDGKKLYGAAATEYLSK